MKAVLHILATALAGVGAMHCCTSRADEAPTTPPADDPQTSPAQHDRFAAFRDPDDGQIDMSEFLTTPRAFLPVPIVITEPATGYGGGLAGMFLRPREKADAQTFVRPNISVAGLFGTENGTRGGFAGDSSRWFDDRLKTLAGGGGGNINLDFYGLGADAASLDQPIRYTLDFRIALLQGNWRLRPDRPWSIGMRYIYANVEPKLRDEPALPGLGEAEEVKVSAPAAILEFDTRDNIFTPTRGVYAETIYIASREELGATVDFERFQQVVMGWVAVHEDVTLGMRGDYQRASDDAPFFLRPYVKLRGVQAMRFQGDEMASAEIEARWRFRGRWSALVAAGAGRTETSNERFSGQQDVYSGAVGFRYELARKFGLHAGVDLGFSSETTAIYFQVGNAWFRP